MGTSKKYKQSDVYHSRLTTYVTNMNTYIKEVSITTEIKTPAIHVVRFIILHILHF
jgi:hypothetical protein